MRSYVARRRDVHAPSRSRKRRFRPLCDDERASGDGAAATTAWAIDRDRPLVVGWTDCGGRLDVSTRTRASLSRRGSAGPRAVGDGAAATRASALDRAARRRPDGLPRPARRLEAHSGDSFARRSTGPRACDVYVRFSSNSERTPARSSHFHSTGTSCAPRRARAWIPPGRALAGRDTNSPLVLCGLMDLGSGREEWEGRDVGMWAGGREGDRGSGSWIYSWP